MSIWDDTRAAWDARDGGDMGEAAPSTRDEFYNHYDGGNALGLEDAEHAECLATVARVQDYHLDVKGWSDIGYNGLVCPHGRAIEGRGLDVVGAHCPGHNRSAYGIQFMIGGDEVPTDAAKARMRRLYDDLCDRSSTRLAKRGHRDGYSTKCPGDAVYEWVEAGMPAPRDGGSQSVPPVIPDPTPKERTLDVDLIDLRDVRPYVTGPGVKPLQRLLDVPDDGFGGPRTRAALGEAQTKARVDRDYIFGPKTAEAFLAGKGGI